MKKKKQKEYEEYLTKKESFRYHAEADMQERNEKQKTKKKQKKVSRHTRKK
jgi:hypothetical protein